jgi:hypothetical protein
LAPLDVRGVELELNVRVNVGRISGLAIARALFSQAVRA